MEQANTQIYVLENELTITRRELQESQADLESLKSEKRSIQRCLETTMEEKKQMTDRINELILLGIFYFLMSEILYIIEHYFYLLLLLLLLLL